MLGSTDGSCYQIVVVFGASALGGDDPQLWLHAAPTQWALIALGGWLILRRR